MHEVTAKSPTSFEEFWPTYLSAHSDRRTRIVHVGGTAVGLLFAAIFVLTGKPHWAVAAFVISYGAAWFAHALFEHNVPATFSHPLWSLRGDLRMLWLALRGRLDDEAAAQRQERMEKQTFEGT